MKIHHYFLIVFSLISMTACAEKTDENHTSHTDHSQHTQSTHNENPSPPAQKFQADEDLQTRMATISSHFKALKTDANALPAEAGENIKTTVEDIFKTCELEPDADAAIHPILANLLKGANLLKAGEKEEGHQVIHSALTNYTQFFDDPGVVL